MLPLLLLMIAVLFPPGHSSSFPPSCPWIRSHAPAPRIPLISSPTVLIWPLELVTSPSRFLRTSPQLASPPAIHSSPSRSSLTRPRFSLLRPRCSLLTRPSLLSPFLSLLSFLTLLPPQQFSQGTSQGEEREGRDSAVQCMFWESSDVWVRLVDGSYE